MPILADVCFAALLMLILDFPGGVSGKEPACNAGDTRDGFDPWVRKIPWRKAWKTPCSILPWRISWTEGPGGLQS